MFPGIADRMQKELTALAPSSMKVRSFLQSEIHPDRSLIGVDLDMIRSRLSHLLSASTPSGLVVRFLRRSPPSRTSGARSRSTTSRALALSTASASKPRRSKGRCKALLDVVDNSLPYATSPLFSRFHDRTPLFAARWGRFLALGRWGGVLVLC